jgi:hypothetical protein
MDNIRYGGQIFYMNVVPADHDKYDEIGQYHMCDHNYYVDMVPADHNEYGEIGRCHMYDQTYYIVMVSADHK